jgi:transposase InsO family protein
MTRTSHPTEREGNRATTYREIIYSDVHGPEKRTTGGNEWFITFIDDFSREIKVSFMKKKSDAPAKIKDFVAWVKNHRKAEVKTIQSDNGGEYIAETLQEWLRANGIIHRRTVAHNPQQNGVAERRNRTLMERTRAFLFEADMPDKFWGEALHHTEFVMNRSPTKLLQNKTPFEAATGIKPDLTNLPLWGEDVWVHSRTRNKLAPRAEKAKWLGFDHNSKGHRVLMPNGTVKVKRDLRFVDHHLDPQQLVLDEGETLETLENVQHESDGGKMTKTTAEHPIDVNIEDLQPHGEPVASDDENDDSDEENDEDSIVDGGESPQLPLERPKCTIVPSRYVRDIQSGLGSASGRTGDTQLPKGLRNANAAILDASDDPDDAFKTSSDDIPASYENFAYLSASSTGVPRSLREAKKSEAWPEYKNAMDAEYSRLIEMKVWKLVEKPAGANIVGCRWVYDLKRDAEGNPIKYKARLVAQGFTQQEGIDYKEIYAPVMNRATMRLIINMANQQDWELKTFDVSTAFLYGEMEEDVYMRQPPEYEGKDKNLVCKLLKGLYRTKQGSRQWYKKVYEILVGKLGFTQSQSDHAVYFKYDGMYKVVLGTHVDDFLTAANTTASMDHFEADLRKHVKLSHAGEARSVLGMLVKRDRKRRTVSLSQPGYIGAILRQYGMEDANGISTPMDPNVTLGSEHSPRTEREREEMLCVPYQEAIGSLMYAAHTTRPDILFAVMHLSQFCKDPGIAHWTAVKRIFRYLKHTQNYALMYGETDSGLEGFTDADWGSQFHRHSVSGYFWMLNGGAISFRSKTQKVVALSSTEAEYIGTTDAAKEGIWLRTLISEVYSKIKGPTLLHCDNQSAITLAKNPAYHARTKHIDIRFHFIREAVANGHFILEYCPTNDMPADALTKALNRTKTERFASMIGLAPTQA